MTNIFANASYKIEPRNVVSGVADREQTLRVVCGEVWITIEGIGHDYWLSAGKTLDIAPGRLVVIEADRLMSRVEVSHPSAQSGTGHRISLFERAQRFARQGKLLAG